MAVFDGVLSGERNRRVPHLRQRFKVGRRTSAGLSSPRPPTSANNTSINLGGDRRLCAKLEPSNRHFLHLILDFC